MKQKIKLEFYFALLFLTFSCSSNDDSIDCPKKQGDLNTEINDIIKFNPRFVTYAKVEGVLSLAAVQLDDDCLFRAIVSFMIENKKGRQDLNKLDIQNRFNPSTSSFSEADGDAVLGSWDLLETEPAWIEIDVLEDKAMEGRFHSTYLHKTNQNDFHSLPDTLRFKNVSFKAELIVLSDDQ